MILESILHIPLSSYAHASDEHTLVFRLRAARGDLGGCTLFYGDRACRQNPIIFTPAVMTIVARDELFDYFEVTLDSPYTRVCYYFLLESGVERHCYYCDILADANDTLPPERSEFYQFPFNRREDIADVPDWAKDAVVYNIFPDSFASGKEEILPNATYQKKSKNGGSINGITANLDYIKSLGINCIYLNPIFEAGEYHKYDTIDYFSVDRALGSNDDLARMVKSCHEKGIRVILDGVFNHCGWNFAPFLDVVKNGANSPYVDWFYGLEFPVIVPENGEDIPNYSCFAYERKMPKLNTSCPEVVEYFCKVCTFWQTSCNIDGWRLDVANEVDHDFWRAFRKTAKRINPNCFIIGEVWETATTWLYGDQFDSTMNYDFRKNSRDFFATNRLDAYAFDGRVTAMRMRYQKNIALGQLNLLDSHDVSRFLSLCGGDVERLRLGVIFQMTFIGVPSVFYGDEKGFMGILEDEYRRPMDWSRGENTEISTFYKSLIALRNEQPALRRGEFETLSAEKNSALYVYKRALGGNTVLVALNAGAIAVDFPAPNIPCVLSEGWRSGRLEALGFAIFAVK